MTEIRLKKDGTPAKKPGRKPDPNKKPKGHGKGRKGPRPHTWIIGEDAGEYKHDMYMPWLKAKAQANFRGEQWTLEFEDFFNLWNGYWHLRGRSSEDLCMSRKDPCGPWSKDNTILLERKEHLSSNGFKRSHSYKMTKFSKLKVQK